MKRGLGAPRMPLLAFSIFAGLLIIILIVFWPFMFVRLSNVDHFYGTISALASSLALVGVAISLHHQARAGRTAREQVIRSLQQQLIRMEMDDPTLMTAIGAPWNLPIPAESAKIREHLYIHMWATTWAGSYVLGTLNAGAARGIARLELFNSKAGRAYWAAVRERALSFNEGRSLQFARIVDEEYQKVLADKVPAADPVKITSYADDSITRRRSEIQRSALIGAALITGAVAGQKFSQKPHRGR